MNQGDVELRLSSTQFDTSALHLHHLRARERMSQLYELELDVVAEGDPLNLDELAGAELEVAVLEQDEELRRFAGMVTRIVERPKLDDKGGAPLHGYRLTLRPTLFLATLVETLDIHLDTTLPAILKTKLALFDLAVGSRTMLNFEHDYPKREMTVQYRETDLAFLSRLCEHWGIYFFFDPAEGQRMIFADSTDGYLALPGDEVGSTRSERSKGSSSWPSIASSSPRTTCAATTTTRPPPSSSSASSRSTRGSGAASSSTGAIFVPPSRASAS